MTARNHNPTAPASGRVRLLGALCCLLLLLPVGTWRSVSLLRVNGSFSETESRPQSEYETESEVLLTGRPASRRVRDDLAVRHTFLCKYECGQAGACGGRGHLRHAALNSVLALRNGCGAVLRC
jgi:hypothetical protein